jgi:hypothetical protein
MFPVLDLKGSQYARIQVADFSRGTSRRRAILQGPLQGGQRSRRLRRRRVLAQLGRPAFDGVQGGAHGRQQLPGRLARPFAYLGKECFQPPTQGLKGGKVTSAGGGPQTVDLTEQLLQVGRRGCPLFDASQQGTNGRQLLLVFDLEGLQKADAKVAHS